MKRFGLAAFVVIGSAALAGCAPADVEGHYTVSTTNGMNGCGVGFFTPGDTASGVSFVVTQMNGAVSGTVEGIAALQPQALLGSGGNVFTGTVSGNHVEMVRHGTNTMSSNGCAYTFDGRIEGTLIGDSLQGSLTYTANTNSSPSCAALMNCQTVLQFSGSRPPQS